MQPTRMHSVALASLLLAAGSCAPPREPTSQTLVQHVTRPAIEIFGQHSGYGVAGVGVNTATGNYTRTSLDLTFPSGLLNWTRTYNSLDSTEGVLGRGWTTALSARLEVLTDGAVAFHDDDGRVLRFAADGAGGYLRPADLDADLTVSSDGGFRLRYLSGDAWIFDASGRNTARTREGQSATLTYDSAGQLTTATHSAGYQL